MSKYNTPIVTSTCPACAERSSHRVTFEDKRVRHLRCDSCGAVHVCAYKGSFHSDIHPLGFAEMIDRSEQGDVATYCSGDAFQPTGLFQHPSLGIGYVFAILSPPKKMEVMFADKVRFLVCGPGSGIPELTEIEPGKKAR